jgi:hypothetical protein
MVKPRRFIAPFAPENASASYPSAPHLKLSLNAAIEIAQQEITRLGLAATHQASALYAGADRQTEGAAFAVIVRQHAPMRRAAKDAASLPRLKLLIYEDGRATLQRFPAGARARG